MFIVLIRLSNGFYQSDRATALLLPFLFHLSPFFLHFFHSISEVLLQLSGLLLVVVCLEIQFLVLFYLLFQLLNVIFEECFFRGGNVQVKSEGVDIVDFKLKHRQFMLLVHQLGVVFLLLGEELLRDSRDQVIVLFVGELLREETLDIVEALC